MEKQLVISFSDGEDVLAGIKEAVKQHDVDMARFRSADGCLKDFELISDDYKDLKGVPEEHFVDKVSGRVLKQKGENYSVDLHLTLLKKAASKTNPVSGELRKGLASGELTFILTLSSLKSMIH